jgi:hypothetical protein
MTLCDSSHRDNVIWKKMLKINNPRITVQMNSPEMSEQTWFRNYKQFAVSIHDNCMEKLIDCTRVLEQQIATNQIDPKDLYQIVNNLMFFLCIYCTDDLIFGFFFRTFYGTIDLSFYCESYSCFLGILLQRPRKPINCIIQFMDSFNTKDWDWNWNWNEDPVWIQQIQAHAGGMNCLQTAILKYDYRYRASNQGTIEYMIDVKKMDVTMITNGSCMLCIALTNKKSDIDLIRYLMKKIQESVSGQSSLESMYPKYLKIASDTFVNIRKKSEILNYREIMGFLISLMNVQQLEEYDTDLLIEKYRHPHPSKVFSKFKYAKHLILSIREKEKLNIMLRKIIFTDKYKRTKIINLIRSVDPRLLDDVHSRYAQIPWINLKYDQFIEQIQENKDLTQHYAQKLTEMTECLRPIDQIDNTSIPVLLFRYNGIPYYGNQRMFDLMDFFKDNDSVNNGEAEILGKVPKYLINLYLNQTLSGHIDLSLIDPSDIFEFIRFIDQYPGQVFAVNLIERHLIQYIDMNTMIQRFPDDILSIFRRYDCKNIMLHCVRNNDPIKYCDKNGLQYSE